jgi:hypothetical protein
VESLRLRYVDGPTKQILEIGDQLHLIERRGLRIKIHEQIEVAGFSCLPASDGTKNAGISRTVGLQGLPQLGVSRANNLSNAEAIPAANRADQGRIPRSGFTTRAQPRF